MLNLLRAFLFLQELARPPDCPCLLPGLGVGILGAIFKKCTYKTALPFFTRVRGGGPCQTTLVTQSWSKQNVEVGLSEESSWLV